MRKIICLFITGIMLAGIAHAEDLAVWEFDNKEPSANNASANAQVIASGIDTAVLFHSVPLNLRGGSYHNDWYNAINWEGPATLAAAIASAEYFTITITSQDGLIMNLTNLFVNICADGLATGESCEVAIFSSAEGFTDGDEIATTTPAKGDAKKPLSIDLSAATHSGLTSVVFRAYCYGMPASGDKFGIGFVAEEDGADDLIIRGTVDSAAQRGTLFLVK